MRKQRIFKVHVRDKESGELLVFILGDNYKQFEDHFLDLVCRFTEKWEYESEDQYAKCYGRIMSVEFVKIFQGEGKFVSFGGLKWCLSKNYDKHVIKHNENSKEACKRLKEIVWEKRVPLMYQLLKDCRIYK